MRKNSILAITAYFALSIGGVRPLYANWGGEAGGSVATGAFKPIGTGQVEMLKEDLRISLYRDRAKVTSSTTAGLQWIRPSRRPSRGELDC